MRKTPTLTLVAVLLLTSTLAATDAPPDPLDWPEEHRAFLSDGPGLLLKKSQREELLGLDSEARASFITSFLADPLPDTEINELEQGINRRRRLAREEFVSMLDERARLVFLHGAPGERVAVDCDQTFKPLEIWTYTELGKSFVVYRPGPSEPYRLWLPLDSKRALYNREMEYWLDQFHELRNFISGRRFDYQLCQHAKRVDEVTGVSGLVKYLPDRPTNDQILALLEPPKSLADWASTAAVTPLPELDLLVIDGVEAGFPALDGQRMITRLTVRLPAESGLESFQEGAGKPEFRVQMTGVVEHDGRVFDQFRTRFVIPRRDQEKPLALVVDRPLRPNLSFLFRLRVEDEISGSVGYFAKAVVVPDQPVAVEAPPFAAETIVALGDQMAEVRVPGRDGIVLVPPESDLVFGLWRADALISGERIQTVRFLVDSKLQFTRKRPPHTAELRLSQFPTEQIVRVEGYDAADELVAADEIALNQQRGELRVRITSPPRGGGQSGEVAAAAEVVVPEERRVTSVEFQVNGELLATKERPPWQATIQVPKPAGHEDVVYLTVVAELDDGSRAEDVRFLNVPSYMDEVKVDFVELYTTVTDRSNRPVERLEAEDFQISEDGRPQTIARFELVDDLPLTIGLTIDTSGSMMEALGEARRAAIGFLDNIITAKDRSFAVRFDNRPELMMPRTSDVGAVADTLAGLSASGSTALHDAIVTSLYYFRGVKGRRALVLLSDGDDTSSAIPFRDALAYARRSGVAIYSIGLGIGRLDVGVRNKLSELSNETGGRAFFVKQALELEGVYEEIEKELRSQYLVAYSSDQPAGSEAKFREVTVKVRGGKYKARTIRGYYP